MKFFLLIIEAISLIQSLMNESLVDSGRQKLNEDLNKIVYDIIDNELYGDPIDPFFLEHFGYFDMEDKLEWSNTVIFNMIAKREQISLEIDHEEVN